MRTCTANMTHLVRLRVLLGRRLTPHSRLISTHISARSLLSAWLLNPTLRVGAKVLAGEYECTECTNAWERALLLLLLVHVVVRGRFHLAPSLLRWAPTRPLRNQPSVCFQIDTVNCTSLSARQISQFFLASANSFFLKCTSFAAASINFFRLLSLFSKSCIGFKRSASWTR